MSILIMKDLYSGWVINKLYNKNKCYIKYLVKKVKLKNLYIVCFF